MNSKILRSVLVVPVNVPRFVEKACLRGADAIVLDMEDSVPADRKKQARDDLAEAISIAGRGSAQLMVRINNDPDLIEADIESAICKRLDALFIPKVESSDQLVKLDYLTREIEASKGLPTGKIKFSIHVESPLGLLRLENMAASTPRIESMSIGVDDYCAALGIRLTKDASSIFLPISQLVITAKAYGIIPIGVLGSVAEFRDLDAFENAATRARDLGSEGSICVHPDQVTILNRVFSPTEESVAGAQKIIETFEEAVQRGRASTSLDGRMVDTPIYKQALATIEKFEAIKRYEGFK
ncbi:MAG: CoA ester lyase [Deltaproteobacteria bacterium]|nr:CoA ester lyase [Deltaproteobacteria bacterium]